MDIPVTIVSQDPLKMRTTNRIPVGMGVVVHGTSGKVVEVHKLNPTTRAFDIIFQDADYKKLKDGLQLH